MNRAAADQPKASRGTGATIEAALLRACCNKVLMRNSRNKNEEPAFRFGGVAALLCSEWPYGRQQVRNKQGSLSMVNHLARADEMRDRAKQCQSFASQTKSEKFADCYRLLSQNYNILATVEEEFFTREMERARAASASHLKRAVDSLSG